MQADHIIKYPLDHPMMKPKLQGVKVLGGVLKPLNHENFLKGFLHLRAFTGQTPRILKAKQSVAGFKVRKGGNSSIIVTLRGKLGDNLLKTIVYSGIFPVDLKNLNIGHRKACLFFGLHKEVEKRLGGAGINVELIITGVVADSRGEFLKSTLLIP